jgi:hypothetical protein
VVSLILGGRLTRRLKAFPVRVLVYFHISRLPGVDVPGATLLFAFPIPWKLVPFCTLLKEMQSYPLGCGRFVSVRGAPMIQPNYVWHKSYVHAVLETNPKLKFLQVSEALTAIEQRRLSFVGTFEERWALANAEEVIKALVSEWDTEVVC